MLKKINILLLILAFFTISCGKKEEEEKKTERKIVSEWNMTCLRWLDRDIFFGTASPFNNNENNEFDKQSVRDVINTIVRNTRLGEDYFRYKTKNADLLQPIRPSGLPQSSYDSFILIWDDTKFNNFVNTNLGGFSNVPDRNAITVVHNTYRRKFYMILRASCFDGEGGFQCNQLGINGLSALIARQIGLMHQMQPADCNQDPFNVMCPIADDRQWDTENRNQFYQDLTSHLITIENNQNFYNDASYSSSCLNKPWMDKNLKLASPEGQKNNTFFMQDVVETLDEISCSTMLGCGYFQPDEDTVPESSIPIYLEKTEIPQRASSYVMIWPDTILNAFVGDNGFSPADPNAIVFINRAYKRNFTLILRSSCFVSNDELCDGGNGGITRNGLSALIARQLGLMVGLPTKDCTREPNHVMCTELPSDFQWTLDEKNRFFNQFNNALEYIGNNKEFYFEHMITLDTYD